VAKNSSCPENGQNNTEMRGLMNAEKDRTFKQR